MMDRKLQTLKLRKHKTGKIPNINKHQKKVNLGTLPSK